MAFAIAIALHEVGAGLIPGSLRRAPREEIVSRTQVATIGVRATPAPTPTPLPSTPAPQRFVSIAPQAASHTVAGRAGGSVAHSMPAARAAALRPAARPVWDVAAAGGAIAGAGTGSNTGTGSGPGSETRGTGSDAGATAPCGYVTFSDPHGSHYDPRTRGFWVDIRMSVHFADGTAQSMLLDYPWYYPSEAANPWSSRNVNNPSFPTRFQPPPSAKIASEPELVKYVMDHSTPDGATMLRDCPEAPPTPAKRRLLFALR